MASNLMQHAAALRAIGVPASNASIRHLRFSIALSHWTFSIDVAAISDLQDQDG